MEQYSNVDGSGPISPTSSGVWRIQKKRKATDRNHRKKDQRNKGEKEDQDVIFERIHQDVSQEDAHESQKRTDHNPSDSSKKTNRKIDLTI